MLTPDQLNSKPPIRIIPRLDIKGDRLIKTVKLEGLRMVGDPREFALEYYRQGADELVFMDIVASLYGRNQIVDLVSRISEGVFIPITIGGGIRSTDDARQVFLAGADKVAVNTAAVARPELISELSAQYGAQAVVLSIEAKRVGTDQEGKIRWEAYTNCGRDHTGLDVVDWARRAVQLGAGEILLTSVDQEGTRKGYDQFLIDAVCKAVSVPVVASGGYSKPDDILTAFRERHCRAFAISDALHFRRVTVSEVKSELKLHGAPIR